MPLWKLQRVGGEVLDFLYENTDEYRTRYITLKPGIAYCFRAFYPFVTSMFQRAWIEYIQKFNTNIIGNHVDLREFLFGAQRSSLTPLKDVLYDLQNGRCFYTGRALQNDYEVDHFIPWSRYPLDFGHNFVLARRNVNRQKSNHVAAEEHLERWVDFCLKYDTDLAGGFESVGFKHSLRISLQVAHWCYNNIAKTDAQVWVSGDNLRKLSGAWQGLLGNALAQVVHGEN